MDLGDYRDEKLSVGEDIVRRLMRTKTRKVSVLWRQRQHEAGSWLGTLRRVVRGVRPPAENTWPSQCSPGWINDVNKG